MQTQKKKKYFSWATPGQVVNLRLRYKRLRINESDQRCPQLKSQSDVTPVPWTQTRGSPRPGDRGEASPPGVARCPCTSSRAEKQSPSRDGPGRRLGVGRSLPRGPRRAALHVLREPRAFCLSRLSDTSKQTRAFLPETAALRSHALASEWPASGSVYLGLGS